MKTIKEAFDEFLKEQEESLSPRTCRGYENVILLFEEYLDICGPEDLYEEDTVLYQEKHRNEHKEYCQIFDMAYITAYDIEYFVGDYLIYDAGESASFIETARRFFRKFLLWTYNNDCIEPEHYNELVDVVGGAKKD